jgi:fatty-acyl-CoA synthase
LKQLRSGWRAAKPVLLTNLAFSPIIKRALALLGNPPLVIDITDTLHEGGQLPGQIEYEDLLLKGDADVDWQLPSDE